MVIRSIESAECIEDTISVGLLRICAELHIHFGQMDVAKELLKEAIKLCSKQVDGLPRSYCYLGYICSLLGFNWQTKRG